MKIIITRAIFFIVLICVTSAFAEPHWTHEEQLHWGALEDVTETEIPFMFPYAECSIGRHQSPVDLAANVKKEKRNRLKIKYPDDMPVFFNSGHAVQVNTSSDYRGQLRVEKEAYPLVQLHFHEPSEHAINGERFPAELHFVHVKENGKIAVLGVLIQEGNENNADLQSILDNMPQTPEEQNVDSGVKISLRALLPKNKKDFYSLAGSLTTPPCSEGVDWYVLANPITISAAQLEQLKSFYADNARHVQDYNGRVVSR